ncbi:MAG: OmpA family protein [Pseudomonadota bacterium]
MYKTLVVAAAVLASQAAGSASAAEPLTDHALVSAYEGATMRRKKVIEFDEYAAFTGMDDTGQSATSLALEGKITKMLYNRPQERSILEVFRNYEMALQQAGAETLYSCDQGKRECVERYAGPTLQKLSDLQAISNLAGRYGLARISDPDNTAYIAVAVGENFIDVHVIEVAAMQRDKVRLDAAALGKGLDSKGYVVVEGIFFDTDKATLKPASGAALAEVAKLLEERPALNVYVVGHTDMQGGFEHNMGLSNRRAASVVGELVERHAIDRARLGAHGVGPLSPAASNGSDAGKARNRRVVLVAR